MKLIAMDLDNTFLHHTSKGTIVHEGDLAALREFEQQGGILAIASGRHYKEIKEISEEYGIGSYFICSNGAYCEDNEGKELYKAAFSTKDAINILEVSEKFSVYRVVADDEAYFCENKDKFLSLIETKFSAHHEDDPSIREKMGTTIDFRKLMFLGRTTTLKRLKNEIQTKFPTYQALFTSKISLEIMPKEASKGHGLQALMNVLSLQADEVAAIGDSENDISMFGVAGKSYTFPNSLENVKASATDVVPSVEDMIKSFKE